MLTLVGTYRFHKTADILDEIEELSFDNVIDLEVARWAKAFTSLPPDEQRRVFFRGRLAGRSATQAFNRPLVPRAAGAAAPDIHDQIRGRELELIKLAANSGFNWPPLKGDKVCCPFPGHPDRNPSWRWDEKKCAYFCTCHEGGNGGGSAIDAVMALQGLDFTDAVEWARKALDLPRSAPRLKYRKNGRDEDPPPSFGYQLADDPPTLAAMKCNGSAPSQFWIYRAANGKIAYIKARYEQANGGKEFRPWTFNGRGWICKQAPSPRPLYNLPALLARPDDDMLFVEGEKPAEAAARIFPEMVPTTTGSKTSHVGVDYSPCKGRRVFLWPDNDHDRGNQGWIKEVSRHCLEAGAAEALVVPVPGESWPDGWDVADDVPNAEEGAVADTLAAMLDEARPYSPPVEAPEPDEAERFEDFNIDDIEGPSLETAYFIDGILPRRGVFVSYGPSSVGKTFINIHRCLHVAAGRDYAGRTTEKALVIYVNGEGGQMFKNRIWLAKKKLGIERGEAAFRVITDMPNMARDDVDTKALLEKIRSIASEAQYEGLPVVVVIDTVSVALKGAREDETGLGIFVTNAIFIAKAIDGLVVVIHHTPKNEDGGPRGSYLTTCNTDGVEKIKENEAGTGGTISIEKIRDGMKGIFWTFDRREEELGLSPRGKPITTCYIQLTSQPKYQPKTEDNRQQGDVCLDESFPVVLKDKGFDHAVDGDRQNMVRAVAIANVKAEFRERYATGKDGERRAPNTVSMAFTRALKNLTRRYRTRVITVENVVSLDQYRIDKNRAAKGEKNGEYCIEIMWAIKHELKPKSFEEWKEEQDEIEF